MRFVGRRLILVPALIAGSVSLAACDGESPSPEEFWAELQEIRKLDPPERVTGLKDLMNRADDSARYYGGIWLCRAHLDANQTGDARSCSEKLLAQAADAPDDWNSPNVMHWANTLLGRIEVDAGQIDAATKHLLASVPSSTSPQLKTIGPDFSLAAVLLSEGRKEDVAGFLEGMRPIWLNGGEVLDVLIRYADEPSRSTVAFSDADVESAISKVLEIYREKYQPSEEDLASVMSLSRAYLAKVMDVGIDVGRAAHCRLDWDSAFVGFMAAEAESQAWTKPQRRFVGVTHGFAQGTSIQRSVLLTCTDQETKDIRDALARISSGFPED